MKFTQGLTCSLVAINISLVGAMADEQVPAPDAAKPNPTQTRTKSAKLQLIDVLRQEGKPRTQYFLTVPTVYGQLNLDLIAAPGTALTQTGTTDEIRKVADQDIEAALKLKDPKAAAQGLLDVTAKYPYYARTYGALADFYSAAGNLTEAEYQIKQLIALQPDYDNLRWLGEVLGRQRRYPEAVVLQQYLWEQRATVPAGAGTGLARDYLVTLTRLQDGKAMITVAEAAMQQYGVATEFYYHYLLGYLLDDQTQVAKTKLDALLPKLDPKDPLYPRFKDMETLINGQLNAK